MHCPVVQVLEICRKHVNVFTLPVIGSKQKKSGAEMPLQYIGTPQRLPSRYVIRHLTLIRYLHRPISSAGSRARVWESEVISLPSMFPRFPVGMYKALTHQPFSY